jgi:WD40 repeat protein
MPFTGKKMYIYTRGDEFSEFALADSSLEAMSIETSAWDPAGNLWVSHDSRGDGPYSNLTWYAYDVSTKELVDSLAWINGEDGELPRGIDFSPDGNIAYIGSFANGTARIQKVVKSGTDVKELRGLPTEYELSQNYPNPFNPTTVINFSIPESGLVSVKVYNALGQQVAELVNEVKAAGSYAVDFNAANLSSGMYIYKISAGNFSATRKMMLLK